MGRYLRKDKRLSSKWFILYVFEGLLKMKPKS